MTRRRNSGDKEPDERLSDLKAMIAKAAKKIEDAKAERSSANEDIGAELAKLETKGISRKAFKMALAYVAMDPDDRRGFDSAYEICREALGLPIQADLLDLITPSETASPPAQVN